jgi:hypothetical protein
VLPSLLLVSAVCFGQVSSWQPNLTVKQEYRVHRVSSSDPTGGNADFKPVSPGTTVTVLDVLGPGTISHI